MNIVSVTETTKGHRVWLQGTCDKYSWAVGMPYHVTFEVGQIVLQAAPEGKRKVSKGKGGIIDLTSKKVTAWAQGADSATVAYDRANGRIIIVRNKG